MPSLGFTVSHRCVHIASPKNNIRFVGLSVPSNYVLYNIVATCSGGSMCTLTGFNAAAVSAFTPVPTDSKKENLCENQGPLPINGRMVWTNTGASREY